jgi:hypothetical protein
VRAWYTWVVSGYDVPAVTVGCQHWHSDVCVGPHRSEPPCLDLLDTIGMNPHLTDSHGQSIAVGQVGPEQRVERVRCKQRDTPWIDAELISQRVDRQQP